MIDPEEQSFAQWAFGDMWEDYLYNPKRKAFHLMRAWNRLHSDLLILTADGNIFDDMKEMKRIWKELYGPKKISKSNFIDDEQEPFTFTSECDEIGHLGTDAHSNLPKKPWGKDGQENTPSHETDGNGRARHQKRQVKASSASASKGRKEKRKAR